MIRLALTPLRKPLGPIVLGAVLALSGLVAPAIGSTASAATMADAYTGYYYSTAPGAPLTTVVISSRPVCLVGQPLCDHVVYLVHPTSPGGDWGTQQTAMVKRLSTQSLNVTFTAPCALSPCLPLTRPRLTLTLTLTPGGLHADIVIGSIVHMHQSHSSETLTRLEMG